MQLLLLFLLLAFVSGVRSRNSEQTPKAWPLVLLSLIVAVGYLSQRII